MLVWRVSNTLETEAFLEALVESLERYGIREIFNTDQGAQNSREAFTGMLKVHGVQISMEGKGRWVDNVLVERLWRSVNYEDVYLRASDSPYALRVGQTDYFQLYNTERRHHALNHQTPDTVYFANPTSTEAA